MAYKNPEEKKEKQKAYYWAHKDVNAPYRKAYRETNKEKIKKYRRRYREANPEKLKARDQRYQKANKEKIKIRKRAYHEANVEKILAYRRAYYEEHREKKMIYAKIYRDAHKEEARLNIVSKKYRLTPDEYKSLLFAQGGVCAACSERCKSGRRLAIDHDHATGVVRGLLCSKCNAALGMLDDSPERIEMLLRYCKKHSQLHLVINS